MTLVLTDFDCFIVFSDRFTFFSDLQGLDSGVDCGLTGKVNEGNFIEMFEFERELNFLRAFVNASDCFL